VYEVTHNKTKRVRAVFENISSQLRNHAGEGTHNLWCDRVVTIPEISTCVGVNHLIRDRQQRNSGISTINEEAEASAYSLGASLQHELRTQSVLLGVLSMFGE